MSVIRKEFGVFAALAALPAALPIAGPAASAAAVHAADQCATRLLSPAEMAAGVPSEVRCYRTQAEMRAASGLSTSDVLAPSGVRAPLADQPLATHYLDANGGGQTLTVYGSSCQGGGLNLSGTFNDSISSTRNLLCGRIKHFADANGNGDYQITSGGLVNMNGTMNDRTSSLYYYDS